MTLKDDLRDFITSNAKSHEIAQNDFAIVEDYYGFAGDIWPSLEEVGERHGQLTRERIRQILNRGFRDKVLVADLDSLKSITDSVSSKFVHLVSDLNQLWVANGWLSEIANIHGVLRLARELDTKFTYYTYDGDLKKINRSNVDTLSPVWLVAGGAIEELRSSRRELQKLVGQVGIISFETAKDELNLVSDESVGRIKEIVTHAGDGWVSSDETAYTFEDWQSPISTNLGKSFHITEEIDLSELVEVITNSFTWYSNTILKVGLNISLSCKLFSNSKLFINNLANVVLPAPISP